MNKNTLIKNFINEHQGIIDFIDSLPEHKFMFQPKGKWTAGQQLSHIHLTILPFLKILPLKEVIHQKFGKIERPLWNAEEVIDKYLNTTLEAPQVYLPESILFEQKAQLVKDISASLKQIQQLLEGYSEAELDELSLPHPLLGKLSIREMFYLMAYHAKHHLKQTQANIQ
jgi:hypothetical protein